MLILFQLREEEGITGDLNWARNDSMYENVFEESKSSNRLECIFSNWKRDFNVSEKNILVGANNVLDCCAKKIAQVIYS